LNFHNYPLRNTSFGELSSFLMGHITQERA